MAETTIQYEDRRIGVCYAAGIIDSEGTITIIRDNWDRKKSTPKYFVMIKVHMCADEAIQLLRFLFGGTITKHKSSSPNARDAWMWTLKGPQTEHALRELLTTPLIAKRPQAEIALELLANIQHGKEARQAYHRLPETLLEERERLKQAIQALNARGC
jgi:hypothetical protein